jgi:hypothetical protein
MGDFPHLLCELYLATSDNNRKIMRLIQLQKLAIGREVSYHANPSLVLSGIEREITISVTSLCAWHYLAGRSAQSRRRRKERRS